MKYYYLIATLPDLTLEDPPKDLDYTETRDLIQRNLAPEDQKLLEYLKLPGDNAILINAIMTDQQDHKTLELPTKGALDPAILKSWKKHINELPEYMRNFISTYDDQFKVKSPAELEDGLQEFFYQEISGVNNDFIRSYYHFEKVLRSMTTLYNHRLFEGGPALSELIDESIEKSFHKGGSIGASIRLAYPFVESLTESLESKQPKYIARSMDKIRWAYIEEQTATRRFSNDHVFGYFLKLIMLERWSLLAEKENPEFINQLMDDALAEAGLTESTTS